MESRRDIQIDNIKGLLIYLVVLGHILSLDFRGSNLVSAVLYSVIYSFHMPCFIFLSGYLVKDKLASNNYYKQSHMLLIYYLFGYLLVIVTKSLMSGTLVIINPFTPPIALWYLFTLFILRTLAPWLVKVKLVVPWCFILSLILGLTSCIGSEFSLSRTICMMPYFAVGLLVDKDIIDRIRKTNIIIKIIIVSSGVAIETLFMYLFMKIGKFNYSILWMKNGYAESNIDNLEGIVFRAGLCFVSLTICLALFVSMTNKKCFLTKWGRNSLAVYLLHTVFYLILRKYMCLSEEVYASNCSVIIPVIISGIIVLILSTNCVSTAINKITLRLGKITYSIE